MKNLDWNPLQYREEGDKMTFCQGLSEFNWANKQCITEKVLIIPLCDLKVSSAPFINPLTKAKIV